MKTKILLQIASDDFNRTDSNNLGSEWAITLGNTWANLSPKIASQQARGDSSGGTGAVRTSGNYKPDQYSTVRRGSNADDLGYTGVHLRVGGASNRGDHYDILASNSSGGGSTFVAINGEFTQLGSSFTIGEIVSSDAVTGEIIGNEIKVYLNGVFVQDSTRTDSSLASGTPGITQYLQYSYQDNWEGGNIGGLDHYPVPTFEPTY